MANTKERKSRAHQKAAHKTILENDIAALNKMFGPDEANAESDANAPSLSELDLTFDSDFVAEIMQLLRKKSRLEKRKSTCLSMTIPNGHLLKVLEHHP